MKLKEVHNGEPEMCFTSLIDIVFLLLIFFMCATHFKQVEQRLDAFLPEPEGLTRNPPPLVPPPERLSIFVKDDAVSRQSTNHHIRALRQATYYPASREARPIADMNELHAILARVHAADPQMRILIAPFDEGAGKDQLVPFFNVVALLDTCKDVGLENVAFQAPAAMLE
jgi:biopolymer transport protein ExbD